MNVVDNKTLQDVIGLEVDDAFALIISRGFKARITKEDGVHKMGTADAPPNRAGLEVEKGKVVKAYIG